MRQLLMFVLLSFFIVSCANKVAPTGGDKDIKAPVVNESVPANSDVNFHDKEVRIKFDEYVQLADVNGQLLISPLMPSMPEVKAIKKEIVIKLPDSLRENTTYTINFGKAITDIHEGNVLENYKFIFSTGAVIDSLFLEGNVSNAKSNELLKGVSVLMYRKEGEVNADSLVFTKRPDYFSKTNDKGFYSISNIAAGEYFVFAVDDKNNNYMCEEDEMLGFIAKSITLPSEAHVDFKCSMQEFPQLKVVKVSKKDRYYFAAGFNKSNDSASIEELNFVTKRNSITEWNATHDTLMVFAKDTLQDSIKIRLFDGKSLNDTVEVKVNALLSRKNEQERLNLFVYQVPESSDTTKSFMFKSEHPAITGSGYAKIYRDTILDDSVALKTSSESNNREFNVYYKWRKGEKYRVIIPAGTITDIYGLKNDTINKSFAMATDRNSGVLIVKVHELLPNKMYLMQLTNEKLDVIKQVEIKASGDYKFEFLNPTIYRVCLVDDIDNNKKWTTGDIRNKQQPENIFVTDKLQVRANWELETEITIQ